MVMLNLRPCRLSNFLLKVSRSISVLEIHFNDGKMSRENRVFEFIIDFVGGGGGIISLFILS